MPPTILVVDDNTLVRDVIREVLELRGYTVIVAGDGAEALAAFPRHRIDAAIVDFDLPETDGVEVCRQLRRRAATLGRRLTVWLMTGGIRSELPGRAAAAGAAGILAKPFTTVELVTTVERALHDGDGRTAA